MLLISFPVCYWCVCGIFFLLPFVSLVFCSWFCVIACDAFSLTVESKLYSEICTSPLVCIQTTESSGCVVQASWWELEKLLVSPEGTVSWHSALQCSRVPVGLTWLQWKRKTFIAEKTVFLLLLLLFLHIEKTERKWNKKMNLVRKWMLAFNWSHWINLFSYLEIFTYWFLPGNNLAININSSVHE